MSLVSIAIGLHYLPISKSRSFSIVMEFLAGVIL